MERGDEMNPINKWINRAVTLLMVFLYLLFCSEWTAIGYLLSIESDNYNPENQVIIYFPDDGEVK